MRIISRRRRARAPDQSQALTDELTAELTASYWRAHDERLAAVGFITVARQFPGLIRQALRLSWEANRRDTFAAIALNLVSGVLTGLALLATTGVLEALFAEGPTPHRVRPRSPRWSWSRWRSLGGLAGGGRLGGGQAGTAGRSGCGTAAA